MEWTRHGSEKVGGHLDHLTPNGVRGMEVRRAARARVSAGDNEVPVKQEADVPRFGSGWAGSPKGSVSDLEEVWITEGCGEAGGVQSCLGP